MIASVGLGEILWSLLVIYFMVMYVIIVFTVWIDVFRSDDISGSKKAIWVLGLLFLPVVSLLAYLLTRGDGIGMRNLAESEGSDRAAARVPPTPATELAVAKQLLDNGAITAAEFDQIKARVLA